MEAASSSGSDGPAAPPSRPQISFVRCDGSILSLWWTMQANPATTCVVSVYTGDDPVVTAEVGLVTHAALALTLAPTAEPYVVIVSAHTGNAPTRDSDPVTIVTEARPIEAATTDPVTGALTVTWKGGNDDQFYARLTVDGAPDPERLVTGPTLLIDQPPPPASAATAGIAIKTVDDNGATSIGPYGPAFVLPTARPDVAAADVAAGGSLSVAWTPVPGAAGYRVTALQGATVVAQADAASPAAGAVLAAEGATSVVVQTQSANRSGPASDPVALVLGAPGITATSCDGATITVVATAPTGVAPDGYELTVLADGAPVKSASVAAADPLATAVDWPLHPGVSYTVLLRARLGRATGPAAAAAVVLAPPEVAAAVCTTDLLVTAMPGRLPAANLAIDAALVTDGSIGTPQRVAADGTTTFALPAGATDVAVAVRGVVGVATGPWSSPTPTPTAAPLVATAAADGRALALAWTGNPQGTFRVELLQDRAVTAETVVQGCSATLPTLAVAAGQAVAQVTELAGVAVGPTAVQLLLNAGPALLAAATQAGRQVTIPWAAPATGPSVENVQPVVQWDGASAALPEQPASAEPLILTLPEDVPNGATVALRGRAGGVVSPLGNTAVLLTVVPTDVEVAYNGATADVEWAPAPNALVDRYAVTLLADGQDPVVEVVPGPRATIAYTPKSLPSLAPTVTVASMAGDRSTGVASRPVDVLAAPPTLVRADYDGHALTLTWSGVSAPATRIAVTSDGVVAHQLDAGGTSAAIALPPGPWTAEARALGPSTLGAPTTVALVTGTPVVSSICFEPATGDCTVTWRPVDGAGRYRVAIVTGTDTTADQTVDAPTVSCTFPADTFAVGDTGTVVVQATADHGGCTVTGPSSWPVPVPDAKPAHVAVAYNGAGVRVAWDPVTQPAPSGYRVSTLVKGVATPLGDTARTDGEWPLTTQAADAGEVVVQALMSGNVGAPSAPASLFPSALFLAPADFAGPSYLAPQAGPTLTPAAISLSLPDLFATTPDPAKLKGLDPVLNLTLAPAASPFGYTLTIPADSAAWSFTNRVDVIAAWVAFVRKLQAPGLQATAAGVLAMQEAVSRAMPQTFAESLYFAIGIRFDQGCFDLRPGVVLRAEFESYQVIGTGTDAGNLSGFVTTAAADYEVASYQSTGRWLNGLDAFLAGLASQGGVTIAAAVPPLGAGRAYGSGGVLDAFATTMQAPFCRVVYPRTFMATNASGSLLPQGNAVILAGATLDAVETATANVRATVGPGGGVAAAYLRGRTVLRPMVRVTVNGVPRLVAAGTTVGNVLASDGQRPPATARPLDGVELVRPTAAAVTDAAAQADVAAASRVRLDWSPGSPDWLDVPLLPGDRLDFEPVGT